MHFDCNVKKKIENACYNFPEPNVTSSNPQNILFTFIRGKENHHIWEAGTSRKN